MFTKLKSDIGADRTYLADGKQRKSTEIYLLRINVSGIIYSVPGR